MDIFESLENLNVSEECFEDIIGIVEEYISEKTSEPSEQPGYYTGSKTLGSYKPYHLGPDSQTNIAKQTSISNKNDLNNARIKVKSSKRQLDLHKTGQNYDNYKEALDNMNNAVKTKMSNMQSRYNRANQNLKRQIGPEDAQDVIKYNNQEVNNPLETINKHNLSIKKNNETKAKVTKDEENIRARIESLLKELAPRFKHKGESKSSRISGAVKKSPESAKSSRISGAVDKSPEESSKLSKKAILAKMVAARKNAEEKTKAGTKRSAKRTVPSQVVAKKAPTTPKSIRDIMQQATQREAQSGNGSVWDRLKNSARSVLDRVAGSKPSYYKSNA